MEKEIWKPVPDYEGLYEVSNYGRVKRLPYQQFNNLCKVFSEQPGGLLSACHSSNGYVTYVLYKNSKRKQYSGHRLVATVFNKNINNEKIVNHIDGNKSNNYYKNLEWVNQRENKTHGKRKIKVSSIYVGVYIRKDRKIKPWCAQICLNGKSNHLGFYDTEEEAHQAYLDALRKYGLKNKYAIKKPPN